MPARVHVRRAWCACFWAVGMLDAEGAPSFTKLIITAILACDATGRPISAVTAALCVSAAFGKSTFESWLGRSSFAASEATTVNVDVAAIINARRTSTPDGTERTP